MLSSADASRRILRSLPPFPGEEVAVAASVGRVLQQAVTAERDQPPFDRVTMDGIAIAHGTFEQGRRRFRIAATQHAGDPARKLDSPQDCIEVMTGTSMPAGADTVIPVERIEVAEGEASLADGYAPERGQFVHRRGSDHRQGTELLPPGVVVAPVDVALLASCGLERVRVSRSPAVRILSTGNELVPAGKPIAAHQIRMSNGPAVGAMLASLGFARQQHEQLPDRPEELERRIAVHLAAAEVLILSGGVSMGKADFVPGVLAGLGVETVFHGIAQRPGKPMWFGIGPRRQAVFALPGNPVSTVVCCRQYVLPALFSASGRPPRDALFAVLDGDVEFAPALTYFLPAKVRTDGDGCLRALPVPTNTSGDFAALSGTDGYVELAADTTRFRAGEVVPFHAWDRP